MPWANKAKLKKQIHFLKSETRTSAQANKSLSFEIYVDGQLQWREFSSLLRYINRVKDVVIASIELSLKSA